VRHAGYAFLLAASAFSPAGAGAEPKAFPGGLAPSSQSELMARSEMARLGDTLEFGGGARATWNYTSGFFAFSLLRLGRESGDAAFSRYGARIVESFITPDGAIRGYDPGEYNLDLVTPGRAVLALYEQSGDPRLAKAAGSLRRQLSTQPRTPEGAFWHKLIYPDQMWLDGLYMAGPFYAHYGALFGEPADRADAARQIILADQHLRDPATGLYYHAWDAKHVQAWADARTGHSPSFWGRSMGWFAMAAADELDDLPRGEADTRDVSAILGRIADGIVRWQDPASGVWWQVLDQGPRPGNYLESSASCMFVYALAKGVNGGWLPRERYMPAALRGYTGLSNEFVRRDPAGAASLTHCCSVAGLNNRNSAGRARDGSFDYYVSEPVVDDDLKGVSAFILAGLEVQRMLGASPSTP
jgi:unsaturated rhamnogalacturonyl hydrolase